MEETDPITMVVVREPTEDGGESVSEIPPVQVTTGSGMQTLPVIGGEVL